MNYPTFKDAEANLAANTSPRLSSPKSTLLVQTPPRRISRAPGKPLTKILGR